MSSNAPLSAKSVGTLSTKWMNTFFGPSFVDPKKSGIDLKERFPNLSLKTSSLRARKYASLPPARSARSQRGVVDRLRSVKGSAVPVFFLVPEGAKGFLLSI